MPRCRCGILCWRRARDLTLDAGDASAVRCVPAVKLCGSRSRQRGCNTPLARRRWRSGTAARGHIPRRNSVERGPGGRSPGRSVQSAKWRRWAVRLASACGSFTVFLCVSATDGARPGASGRTPLGAKRSATLATLTGAQAAAAQSASAGRLGAVDTAASRLIVESGTPER